MFDDTTDVRTNERTNERRCSLFLSRKKSLIIDQRKAIQIVEYDPQNEKSKPNLLQRSGFWHLFRRCSKKKFEVLNIRLP
jgi:hypothetical protein